MKKVLLLAGLCALTIASCKKNKKASNTSYLTNGQWYQKSAVASVNINGTTLSYDLFMQFPECMKDDYRVFERNGDVIKNEGMTKCNEEDPQEAVEGQWMFTESETMIQLPLLGNMVDMKIVELNRDMLVVQAEQNYNGALASFTLTFAHE